MQEIKGWEVKAYIKARQVSQHHLLYLTLGSCPLAIKYLTESNEPHDEA